MKFILLKNLLKVLSDYKNIYLNDLEKAYFYNSTENKTKPTN